MSRTRFTQPNPAGLAVQPKKRVRGNLKEIDIGISEDGSHYGLESFRRVMPAKLSTLDRGARGGEVAGNRNRFVGLSKLLPQMADTEAIEEYEAFRSSATVCLRKEGLLWKLAARDCRKPPLYVRKSRKHAAFAILLHPRLRKAVSAMPSKQFKVLVTGL
jgi:hypothetical protein